MAAAEVLRRRGVVLRRRDDFERQEAQMYEPLAIRRIGFCIVEMW